MQVATFIARRLATAWRKAIREDCVLSSSLPSFLPPDSSLPSLPPLSFFFFALWLWFVSCLFVFFSLLSRRPSGMRGMRCATLRAFLCSLPGAFFFDVLCPVTWELLDADYLYASRREFNKHESGMLCYSCDKFLFFKAKPFTT